MSLSDCNLDWMVRIEYKIYFYKVEKLTLVSMRKSLLEDKKPKLTKKKDKKTFSKVNKNRKSVIRWS